MNVKVTYRIVEGSGTLPKNVVRNSVIYLDASINDANSYSWEIISKPSNSTAYFYSPITDTTRFGPLDKNGVYQVKLLLDSNGVDPQYRILSFTVPGTISDLPIPTSPSFEKTGRRVVLNGTFSIAGSNPGEAAYWTTVDDANVLATGGGSTRGRIIPTNFTTENTYVFCLGDDLGGNADITANDTFEINQDVDLTDVDILELNLKFTNTLP